MTVLYDINLADHGTDGRTGRLSEAQDAYTCFIFYTCECRFAHYRPRSLIRIAFFLFISYFSVVCLTSRGRGKGEKQPLYNNNVYV